jgi:Ni,Fe-hydrogenase III large subunit
MRDCKWHHSAAILYGETLMKPELVSLPTDERANRLKDWLQDRTHRLGMITSIDGNQLITLVLDTANGSASLWDSPVSGDSYSSATPLVPQCHWYERTLWDMFGLYPKGHPRLKHNLLHEPYHPDLVPLREGKTLEQPEGHRTYRQLEVKGEGIYELPVGPIHAGIIEPGHFRFSCLGEVIINLEIRLGYVHRGVEKRLTEVHWTKACHVAEAAASDTVAANAFAHAVAIESILDLEAPSRAQALRILSLEIERVAMHVSDLGGLGGDIGFSAISSSMARLRGDALRLGELLSGTRFQRAFIRPGGVAQEPSDKNLMQLRERALTLASDLAPVLDMLLTNQAACERMQGIGRVSPQLARDFGLVGVGGRASNVQYDTRLHFRQGVYPTIVPSLAFEMNGDVFCRARVRILELYESLGLIEKIVTALPSGPIFVAPPTMLPANRIGLGIVEGHRGELIHLVFTDGSGKIHRYAIKDPSLNNWTGLAIAVRNNLVADFPLCNKSFSLSYSGHDL